MLPDPNLHPEAEKLIAFGHGRLSEADSREIELHMADCHACRDKLEELPEDSLVRLLRESAQTDTSFSVFTTHLATPTPADPEAASTSTIPPELQGHERYVLFEPLGMGGMGTVYKARHRLMDRIVAIKIINPQLVNHPGAVDRFAREVRAAAQLVHPHIVTAYDAEKVGNLHLLVMEYVQGQTLAQLLAVEQVLPIAEACEYLRQTALGLQQALEQNMVHRDIKPHNLMRLTSQAAAAPGVIKILDFGLARFVREQANFDGVTEFGMLIGSPDYMAPEQSDDAHAADTRGDIYAMGCTLYHLLAGQVPFPEISVRNKLEAHRSRLPTPLHLVRPAVPRELSQVVSKMMAKNPLQRYQTPAEVAEALRPFTPSAAAVPAPLSSGQGDRSSRAGLSRRSILLFAGAGGLLLLGLSFGHRTRLVDWDRPDRQNSVIPGGEKTPVVQPADERADEDAGKGDPATMPPPAFAPFSADHGKSHQEAWARYLGTTVESINTGGARMVLIPPGEFLMGSSDKQVEAALQTAENVRTKDSSQDRIRHAERPQHRVVITRPFLMSATEVTIGQFRQFADATGFQTRAEQEGLDITFRSPGYPVTDEFPAVVIEWHEAVAYCDWLTQREQVAYRLPTEAEWEYACRAGTTTQFSFGDDHADLSKYGWYSRNAGGQAHAVASKLPNAFGLFDMHGNVSEWCRDFWKEGAYQTAVTYDPLGPKTGISYVTRGGSWSGSASHSRSAFRSTRISVTRSEKIGFRVVRIW